MPQVEIEIGNCFQLNKGTVDDLMVWVLRLTLGEYLYHIRPINGSDHSIREQLMKQVEIIEKRNKQEPLLEWQKRVQKSKGDIALMDTQHIAKDIMFSK